MRNRQLKLVAIAGLPATLLACAGTQPNQALEQARSAVRAASNDRAVVEGAPTELERAQESLASADALYEESGNKERAELEHLAYLANRYTDIAVARGARYEAELEVASAETERNEILIQAREAEAARAEAEAARAELQATRAQASALAAAEEARSLEQQLADLEAERTERGIVLTLGDVLFDTDRAELKVGAEASLERLADFMGEYTERTVTIEGHTDSRGPEEYNRELSMRRAAAVRDALLVRGIDAQRIRTRGLGETVPVASNETGAGRQQNRRVEVIISDPNV